jgi:hypothetical protein
MQEQSAMKNLYGVLWCTGSYHSRVGHMLVSGPDFAPSSGGIKVVPPGRAVCHGIFCVYFKFGVSFLQLELSLS